ncbi:hypothetical protein GJ496_008638 [Pomphorhynchus laevis]|nr:hypothetical protein GJ496_008638 [Pomphorhynchus laevis]
MIILNLLFVYELLISINYVHSNRLSIANEIIDTVNNKHALWKASNSKFDSWSKKSIDYMLGVSPLYISAKMDQTRRSRDIYKLLNKPQNEQLPTNFDPRNKWPECKKSLNEVRDQGSCGSCWAFGAVEAMTDRICIKSGGKENAHLSAQDLVACCKSCGMGCFGGFPTNAWQYYINEGIVSGGNYATNEGCIPYSIPSCEHHANGSLSPCGDITSTPKCKRRCIPQYGHDYTEDKHFGEGYVGTSCIEEDIMLELFNNGPVEAAMLVFEDFLNYKSGVYHHVTGSLGGGHAIKLMGWGVTDDGEKYWTAVNSWNNDWGENGWFRIRRGIDECGIESDITFATPAIKQLSSPILMYRSYVMNQLFFARFTLLSLSVILFVLVILFIRKGSNLRHVVTKKRGYNQIE